MAIGRWHAAQCFHRAAEGTPIRVMAHRKDIYIVECQWPLFKGMFLFILTWECLQRSQFILSQGVESRGPFMWPTCWGKLPNTIRMSHSESVGKKDEIEALNAQTLTQIQTPYAVRHGYPRFVTKTYFLCDKCGPQYVKNKKTLKSGH